MTVESLPRTPYGKVVKSDLRAQCAARRTSSGGKEQEEGR